MRKMVVSIGIVVAMIGTFIMMWKLLSLFILPKFPEHPSKFFSGSWTIYCFIGSYILYLLLSLLAKIHWRRFFGSIFRLNFYYGLLLLVVILLVVIDVPKEGKHFEINFQIAEVALIFLASSLVFRLIAWKGRTRLFLL